MDDLDLCASVASALKATEGSSHSRCSCSRPSSPPSLTAAVSGPRTSRRSCRRARAYGRRLVGSICYTHNKIERIYYSQLLNSFPKCITGLLEY
jgi:hypothetical protein